MKHLNQSVFNKKLPLRLQAQIQDFGNCNGYSTFAECYLKSADALWDKIVHAIKNNDGNQIDFLGIPLVFNLRQSVELQLKALIKLYVTNTSDEFTGLLKKISHNLDSSWDILKPKLLEINDYMGYYSTDEFDKIEAVILDLSTFDDSSEKFRYPFDKRGNSNTHAHAKTGKYTIDPQIIYSVISQLIENLKELELIFNNCLFSDTIDEKYIKENRKDILAIEPHINKIIYLLNLENEYDKTTTLSTFEIIFDPKNIQIANDKINYVKNIAKKEGIIIENLFEVFDSLDHAGFNLSKKHEILDKLKIYKNKKSSNRNKLPTDTFLFDKLDNKSAEYLLKLFDNIMNFINDLKDEALLASVLCVLK